MGGRATVLHVLRAGVLLMWSGVYPFGDLVAPLPNFAEANGRMVAIEDGQRRANVGYNGPLHTLYDG